MATSSIKAEYVAAASCCTQHVTLMKSWLVQKQTALGVNTPRCDEDRLALMELTVFLLPKDEKVRTGVSAADLHVYAVWQGVECLLNEEIFAELARIGYEKPSTKLTFYKAFFLSQWKFLIHTILQYMRAKRTSWNEFSSSMASAVICLSSGDLSTHTTKYTSPALTQKVFANIRRVAHDDGVPTAGDTAEGDVSASHDEVPTNVGTTQRIDSSDETMIDDVSNQGRMIVEMDQDADVVLEDDKEVADDVKADQDAKVVDVVTTTKIITEVLTATSETITAASTTITAAEAQVHAVTLTAAPARVTAAPSRRRKGVVIRDPKEESTTSTSFLLKPNPRIMLEEEESRALKRLNETPSEKEAKRQKLDEEVEELKRHLQIVPNEDDDVYTEATPLSRKVPVVDYEIINLNNKPYFKIIRADGTHQLYVSFLSLLKNFDREDLEALWSLVKKRFATAKPKNFSDDFLLMTLGAMFEKPDIHAQIWKNQRSVHGPSKVKATKDKTSRIFKRFITEIENLVEKKVKIIRCDNGTKFKNTVMNEFCEEKDSKLPTTFWAEAVNTACYVQNRVLVVMPHFKTPYELFKGSGPEWLFDIDDILKSMNYAPESAGTNSNNFVASESDIQERPNAERSTITVNTTGPVNTATPTYADYPNDPLMPDLEDAGIFDDAYDDRDEGAEANYNNLETIISVSPIHSTRIHKDHPKDLIIGETLVDLPSGKRAIGTKWVYRNKRDQRGIVVRNKARLVAQGHRQEEGIDYDEVFAPVAQMAYASFMDFTPTSRLCDLEFPNRVYKVEKALYGLHQALRAWYETLSTYLLDNRFKRRTIDKTLFTKQIKDDILLVQVVKSASTPIKTHKPLSKDAAGTDVAVHLYRSMIGSLMYLTSSMPDIMFATKIHVDNESAICVVKNPFYHSKTKHIEIRHHFITDSYEKRLIEMVKIHTDYNVADLLTKAFDVTRFQFLIASIGLKLKGYLINDGYADLVQHADNKEWDIPWKTATGKELSNPLMAGSLPKTTLPTLLSTLKIKTVNDDVWLQALIDRKKVIITEASIRHDLKLNDAEGTSCLTNAVIFEELARMSNTMASAIICLVNNKKFNFSKYILDNLKKNLEAGVPFYMFPRKHKPRRKEKKERKETEVSPTELPTVEHVPTPSNDPLPSGEDSMPLKELMVLCTNLSNKVLNEVIEIKSSHKAKISELESRVEKFEEENRLLTKELKSFNSKVESPAFKEIIVDKEKSSKQGRKIADIDADTDVNLENVYNLDLAHEETVLSMQDITDADGKKVAKEMVKVITTTKIIVDEVSTASGELNATNKEPVSAAPANITTTQPIEATKKTVDIPTAPKAKGIVFHDMEESTTRIVSSKPHVKDKGKAKLVEEPEVLKSRKAQIAIDEEVVRRIEAEWNADIKDNIYWIKGMSYEEIRPLFEEEYNKVQTLFKEGPEIDAERTKAPRKRTRKENVEKDQSAKKQKGDELEKDNAEKQKMEEQQEAEELKRNLEIVPYDEDDMYLAFSTMLKNFDREDLEVLWKIVKDMFKDSQPKEVLDVFLWHTLKEMSEHSVEDSVWKLQKGPKGLARVKN
nr:hypothetical protein [Tanacetum cinerariifolium]